MGREISLAELHFPSTEHTYIRAITDDINGLIRKSRTEAGSCLVSSPHTTLGLIVQEIVEPNLVRDMVDFVLKAVPEDVRSSHVVGDYKNRYPVADYRHRCQDNPRCDLVDEDYNAASHLRCMQFAQQSVTLAIRQGGLVLGKYQDLAVFEFDGRDGTGKNPVRQRTVQVWIYSYGEIVEI